MSLYLALYQDRVELVHRSQNACQSNSFCFVFFFFCDTFCKATITFTYKISFRSFIRWFNFSWLLQHCMDCMCKKMSPKGLLSTDLVTLSQGQGHIKLYRMLEVDGHNMLLHGKYWGIRLKSLCVKWKLKVFATENSQLDGQDWVRRFICFLYNIVQKAMSASSIYRYAEAVQYVLLDRGWNWVYDIHFCPQQLL